MAPTGPTCACHHCAPAAMCFSLRVHSPPYPGNCRGQCRRLRHDLLHSSCGARRLAIPIPSVITVLISPLPPSPHLSSLLSTPHLRLPEKASVLPGCIRTNNCGARRLDRRKPRRAGLIRIEHAHLR
ncbi:hypothetical protein DENSPDRAFT_632641 [Dentipellis sp. KUC8613]|nr:hypothetical protein DENSPDRAFT_632641 [Dentipellis sp. KUC8613]